MRPTALCPAIALSILMLAATAAARPATVGLVIDGPPGNDLMLIEALVAEIAQLNAPTHIITAPPDKRLFGDDDPRRIAAHVDTLMTDPAVDLVIGIGAVASHVIARRASFDKPAFAPLAFDPAVQGLPRGPDGTSGVPNLNYLTVPYDLGRALTEIKQLFGARKVALMTPGSVFEVAPAVPTALMGIARAAEVELVLAPMGRDPTAAIADIPADVDAVLVTPLGRADDAETTKFAAALAARKLPSFAFLDARGVQQGLVAAEVPRRYFERLRRRLALNIQRTLDGEDPGTFPTTFDAGATRLWINLDAARAVGIEFGWATLVDARVIGRPEPTGRTLTLEDVVREARARHLDLRAELLARDAGLEQIREARANLLPALDLALQGRVIDSDRAATSFGTSPQYLAAGALTLTQVIYSEGAWAGLSVQQILQDDRDAALRALELDTIQAAAVAWLNVLRSRSLIETRNRNLEAARENLELALVRRSVGASTDADVWRWESEIAAGKQELIAGFASVDQAQLQLNRLLDRPDAEVFAAGDEAATAMLLQRFGALMAFLGGPSRFEVFKAFVSDEAIRHAPEIVQLDAAIAATERDLTRITRSYYLPDFILQGELSGNLYAGGEGDEPPDLSQLGFASEESDDINWEIKLVASLPLYDGSARYAEADRARLDIQRLRLTRESLARKLRQQVQTELLGALSSFSAIELSRARRDAARKSLDLTAQSYRLGAVSIADLVDAQTNAFAAEQGAVNAVYDFMVAMVNVERAIGVSFLLAPEDERAAFIQRVQGAFTAPAAAAPDASPVAPTPEAPTPETPTPETPTPAVIPEATPEAAPETR